MRLESRVVQRAPSGFVEGLPSSARFLVMNFTRCTSLYAVRIGAPLAFGERVRRWFDKPCKVLGGVIG